MVQCLVPTAVLAFQLTTVCICQAVVASESEEDKAAMAATTTLATDPINVQEPAVEATPVVVGPLATKGLTLPSAQSVHNQVCSVTGIPC